MPELINLFPKLLLGIMIVLTLILLPLLNNDPPHRHDDDHRHDDAPAPSKPD